MTKLIKSKDECLSWNAPSKWECNVDKDIYTYLSTLLDEIEYEREMVSEGFDCNLDALRAFIYAWECSYHSFTDL